MKSLLEIAHLAPLDGYQAANLMYELQPGDKLWNDSQLAAESYRLFDQAGWEFVDYNEYGQPTYRPAQ